MTANGTALKFYINGSLVWSGTDTEFSTGKVGIGMYRNASSTGNRLYADWANLNTTVADEVAEPVAAGEKLPGGDDTGHP
ncbi:MAG: hypothetical protein NUV74_16920 [Candidatus Brocadiaceae bacterium]|nr:hypothetical protein [Candidatus Brocadiaceae bacterium]